MPHRRLGDGREATAHDAVYLHTATVGMVIDRLAQFSVDCDTESARAIAEPQPDHARQHLTELALAYIDLSFEIAAGIRRLPNFSFPAATDDADEQQGQ